MYQDLTVHATYKRIEYDPSLLIDPQVLVDQGPILSRTETIGESNQAVGFSSHGSKSRPKPQREDRPRIIREKQKQRARGRFGFSYL